MFYDKALDDDPSLMPSDEVAINDEPMHEDLLSYYLYDEWVETNSISTIDFNELAPLYDNSLDDDHTCETMVSMTSINEKVFAWNHDNYYEFGSGIGSTNILEDNKILSLGMPMHPKNRRVMRKRNKT